MKQIPTEKENVKYKNQIKESIRAHKLRLITALLFIGAGAGLGRAGQTYAVYQQEKADEALALALAQARAAVESEQPKNPQKTEVKPKQLPKEETKPEAEPAYQPSPDRLNLAYYYPEGSDSGEIIDSYAGQVFQELTILDSEWLADIYELADVKPPAMAERLGQSQDSALGAYNPKDDAHNPEDPSSWTINNWKRIHISFIDGDGRAISGISNVKDILSMASVYTYYTDMMDVDAFTAYARQLWENSHSYTVRMGDVYYCEGCMNKTDEELAMEEALDEEAASEAFSGSASSFHEDEAGSGADSGYPDSGRMFSGSTSSSASEASDPGTASAEPSSEELLSEGSGEATPETVTVIYRNTAPAASDYDAPGDPAASGDASEEYNGAASGSSSIPSDDEQPESDLDLSNIISIYAAPVASSSDAAVQQSDSSSNGGVHATDAIASCDLDADGESELAPYDQTEQENANCPGHVDLYIQVKLLGLNDRNGLLFTDAIGNDPDFITSDGWEGWTEENIAHVNAISSQDWFADYGLSISAISLSTPLSGQEIADYMDQLPNDLSETRREIIHFALSSVGRVPYYYGGKASRANYEGNNFGALVSADHEGRILKGLDCSGWIDWVYWSATGKRLAGSSTSSLALCGEKISRSELQPGDIIVRTGASAHVVMFLSWSADGRMNVIHESSASVNNVTIKTMDAIWPYYRKLVE